MIQNYTHALAHITKSGKVDYLYSHLSDTANRAAQNASALSASDEAKIASLLHDIGKYGDFFQARLLGKEKGIDHWSAGAWAALTKYKANGVAIAMAVQGHHIGLQKADKDSLRDLKLEYLDKNHPLDLKLSENDLSKLINAFEDDGLKLPQSLISSIYEYTARNKIPAAVMLNVRMLYSALVDADFIETEAFFQSDDNGNKVYRKSGLPLKADESLNLLLSYVEKLPEMIEANDKIKRLRNNLFHTCLEAGELPPGLFTLTAPTGSGKTLSMLAFALKHAQANNLRRIIFVIPYLSIIDQTVDAYRKILTDHFGDDYILEDHSLAETKNNQKDADEVDEINYQKKLLAENWDAPIIITTSVQFFESLFANRSSACRKLHNLAKSVILFDEAQNLPSRIAIPTLATLSHLADRYGSSIVFSTATQPAFTHIDEHVKKYCAKGWKPIEIVPASPGLFNNLQRFKVTYQNAGKKLSWPELAEQLLIHKQVLCIVNLKRHAQELYKELDNGYGDKLFHLSTNMCPAHRRDTLDKVIQLLKSGKPCLLVSTQCVEAGVDIDFPVVYRAFGPLDAITQAAGRCNRNGLLITGKVVVFAPDDERLYPNSAYGQAAQVALSLLKKHGTDKIDIGKPEIFEEYYKELYDISDIDNQNKELQDAIKRQDFVETANLYRVIDKNAINVLVPYGIEIYDQLTNEARKIGISRDWISRARPHSIGLFPPRKGNFIENFLEPVTGSDTWFIYCNKNDYHKKMGLLPPSDDLLIG